MASANLAAGLITHGYDVTVATRVHPSRTGNEIPSARVVEFAVDGSASARFKFTGEVERYRDFIRSFSCDFIVCQCWDAWSTFLAQKVFKDNPAKKVLVSHGFTSHLLNFHPKPFFGLGVWLGTLPVALTAPWTMRCYDRVVFISKRKDLRRFFDHTLAHWTGYRTHSIIPNGISHDIIESAKISFRKKYGIETRQTVLNVANYCDRKNQSLALTVFAEANVPDSTLVFIGSERNQYAVKLEEHLRRLRSSGFGLPVKILYNVPRPDVAAAFQSAEVFLLTAKAETMPFALLEAISIGVPFVSTNVGCVDELPGGKMASSRGGLVRQLRSMLQDPEMREQLGKTASSIAKTEFTWEKNTERFVSLLESL
ncbi:MAG: glycosyltransferase family 4 protein [Verrucomicrobia bacterium]|nr:glycosyltransferase family 4 protein [Verrucomicrobiota bacterium]